MKKLPSAATRLLPVALSAVLISVALLAPASSHINKSVKHVTKHVKSKIARDNIDVAFADGANPDTSSGTAFGLLPGSQTTITVRPGTQAILVASFTAESACFGGGGWCSVRLMVDGNEMLPATDTDFAFDSTDSNTETSGSWESHAVERRSTILSPGSYVVSVETARIGATNFRLDDWQLTVQRIRTS